MAFQQSGLILKTLLENPELLKPPTTEKDSGNAGKKKTDDVPAYNNQSAFLGPNIWSNNAAEGGEDFNFEYMDLEEFLTESGIEANGELFGDLVDNSDSGGTGTGSPPPAEMDPRSPRCAGPQSPRVCSQSSPAINSPLAAVVPGHPVHTSNDKSNPTPQPQAADQVSNQTRPRSLSTPAPDIPHPHTVRGRVERRDSLHTPAPIVPVDFAIKEHDLALANVPGKDDFDPRRRNFTEDELRPQPMIKKSSKVFVPDEQKDDKYWYRRNKNNIAAKRSRDARRIKENQITLRAAFLEKQADCLQEELTAALEENKRLKERLAKYEPASASP